MPLLSLVPAFLHCWKWEVPRACLPVHGDPMTSRSFSMLPACATDGSAAYLCPDLVITPTCLTCSSWESLYVITTLHFATLNSSTTDDIGSWSCSDLMSYRLTAVKLGVFPNHFRRYLLIFLSIPSTHVIRTSYTVSSHMNLGNVYVDRAML